MHNGYGTPEVPNTIKEKVLMRGLVLPPVNATILHRDGKREEVKIDFVNGSTVDYHNATITNANGVGGGTGTIPNPLDRDITGDILQSALTTHANQLGTTTFLSGSSVDLSGTNLTLPVIASQEYESLIAQDIRLKDMSTSGGIQSSKAREFVTVSSGTICTVEVATSSNWVMNVTLTARSSAGQTQTKYVAFSGDQIVAPGPSYTVGTLPTPSSSFTTASRVAFTTASNTTTNWFFKVKLTAFTDQDAIFSFL